MADATDDEDAKLARVLFRYRLIAEAAEAPKGARAALMRESAGKHTWPDGRPVRVSLRTLQRWLKRFKHGGLAALGRAPRKDKGRVRALSEAAVARVIALRHEETARSTPTLIDIVERAGEVAKGSLRRSTLDRHLDRRGASRRMLHVLGEKRHVRLHFDHPFDFVLADFHAGPYIRTATGEVRRSELGAFIDHCSRFVPESRYGLTEDLMHVRRGRA
jgi:transposase